MLPGINQSAVGWKGSLTATQVILVPMLGQSNMVGRSTFDAGSETDGADIFQYANDTAGVSYQTITSDITPLLYPEGQQPLGGGTYAYQMGPGNALLKKIAAQNPDAKIIAVPCAVGATGLVGAVWASSATPGSGGSRFEAAVAAVNAAYTQALAAYPGASVSVITAWVQGENDAAGGVTRSVHGTALASLITHWRSRVSGTHGKFIIGSMLPQKWLVGSGQYEAATAAINAAHVDVSLAVSNVVYVAGPDVRGGNDNLHYGPYSVNQTFGDRMGDSLADVTGPSVTTSTTQGGFVGTTSNILLTHDDPSGHATFHFAGGANDALFEITDPYVNGTTQPQVRLIDNATAAGSYELKVRARDGAGNYGATRTIAFTQAEPAAAPITTFFGEWYGLSGFGEASTTVDIKAGLNLFTLAYPASGNFGAAATGTVNGNALTKLGYSGGSNSCILFAYESASHVEGATLYFNWGSGSLGPFGRHVVVTGIDAAPTQVVAEGWQTIAGGSQALPSLTVPTDGIAIGFAMSANAISGAAAGTDLIGRDPTDHGGGLGEAAASRSTTGQISFAGGGGFSAHIGAAFAKTA